MELFVKIVTMRAGSAEPVGDPVIMPCPADVEPDTIESFLIQRFGEPADVAWTTTDRHPRVSVGWIFTQQRAETSTGEETELLCVPLVRTDDGPLQPMFLLLADQRQEFEQLASAGAIDTLTVIEQPQREYRPGNGGNGGAV